MKDKVSLLLDTSRDGLHKRGYRLDASTAPLKETLAAALCNVSRLRPYHKLYDPMCGSGTILIEGAMMACGIAPGVNRFFFCGEMGCNTARSMGYRKAESPEPH
jgi:putative N6-adenine-specific DNA methylase